MKNKPIYIDPGTHAALKTLAIKRGQTLAFFTAAILRSAVLKKQREAARKARVS